MCEVAGKKKRRIFNNSCGWVFGHGGYAYPLKSFAFKFLILDFFFSLKLVFSSSPENAKC